jgi:hypothetical protein
VTWVTLTQPFWLGRTAVTQGQYEAVMGSNPSQFKVAGRDAPVENVPWYDAMAFCAKLTEREKAAGRLPTGYAYTLPTEAEWEYACRAGTSGPNAGDLDAMAWFEANSGGRTHPVGTKQPNAWGLYDMSGNVAQWCLDRYGYYLGDTAINPFNPMPGAYAIYRGGAWSADAMYCSSTHREALIPGGSGFVGFRLALSVIRNPDNFSRWIPYDDAEIRQYPDKGGSYVDRGVDRDAMANYEGAISDFVQAIKLANDDAAYERYFLLLTLRRLHRSEAPAGLALAMPAWNDHWHIMIGRFLTGGLSEADFLTAADQGVHVDLGAQHCEAYYYVGMTHLLAGDTTTARSFFDQCVGTHYTSWQEFELAQAELARLAASPQGDLARPPAGR